MMRFSKQTALEIEEQLRRDGTDALQTDGCLHAHVKKELANDVRVHRLLYEDDHLIRRKVASFVQPGDAASVDVLFPLFPRGTSKELIAACDDDHEQRRFYKLQGFQLDSGRMFQVCIKVSCNGRVTRLRAHDALIHFREELETHMSGPHSLLSMLLDV
jgi:hypothetical protein